jgi:hypothetical protein
MACSPGGARPEATREAGAKVESPSPTSSAGHDHEAPHGGTLVELGDEFAHVEVVLDPGEGRLTAYVLDGEAESSVRVAQRELALRVRLESGGEARFVLTPAANPLTGETAGDTSQFELRADELRGLRALRGRIETLTVNGSVFREVAFAGAQAP